MKPIDTVTPEADGGAVTRSASAGRLGARSGAQREELVRLAQEFEAVLMNEMLSGWRQSLMADDEESGGKQGVLADMVGTEFGRALSRSGGLGIGDVLIRALHRRYGATAGGGAAQEVESRDIELAQPTTTQGVPLAYGARPGPSSVGAVPRFDRADATADLGSTDHDHAAPDRSLTQPPAGVVTSGFGWRTDPINGRQRFHTGADVRMAYGEEVSTAASGRVRFAGDRAGYGLTVEVDHGNGYETRYAHLSSASVKPGDVVDAGSVIARSGNSGRSTGPHLHVELLRHGQALDPSSLLTASRTSPDPTWEVRPIGDARRLLTASPRGMAAIKE